MQIDQLLCAGCGECIPYCPVGAIRQVEGSTRIELDSCVECGTCRRCAPCPTGAIQESPEAAEWPRVLRRHLSDPTVSHSTSALGFGRGNPDFTTNDVTGRLKPGRVAMGLDFGRPGVAVRLGELEPMTIALAAAGVDLEPRNPITSLLSDTAAGLIREDVKGERVLTAVIEFEIDSVRLPEIAQLVEDVATRLDTAFSWCFYTRLAEDGSNPLAPILEKAGLKMRPNAKVNLGLGRRPPTADR